MNELQMIRWSDSDALTFAAAWAKEHDVAENHAAYHARHWSALRSRWSCDADSLERYLARQCAPGRSAAQLVVELLNLSLGNISHECGLEDWDKVPDWPHVGDHTRPFMNGCLACVVMRDAEHLVGDPERPNAAADVEREFRAPGAGALIVDRSGLPALPDRFGVWFGEQGGTVSIERPLARATLELNEQELRRIADAIDNHYGVFRPVWAPMHVDQESPEETLRREQDAYLSAVEEQLDEARRYLTQLPRNPMTAEQIRRCEDVLARNGRIKRHPRPKK